VTDAFRADLAAFYAENPQHIAGIVTEATNTQTGERVSGHMLDSESLAAFFCWLVSSGRRRPGAVRWVWERYHEAAPEDFPLPPPWERE
jgi:hypothetical protein